MIFLKTSKRQYNIEIQSSNFQIIKLSDKVINNDFT